MQEGFYPPEEGGRWNGGRGVGVGSERVVSRINESEGDEEGDECYGSD